MALEKKLERFQHNVRMLRKQKGYTQEELSRECGYSTSYVGKIERGEKHPSLTTLFRLAEVLDVSVVELFDGKNTVGQSMENPNPSRSNP